MARGLAGFRWLSWSWAVAVLVVTRADLSRPMAAWGLLGVAGALTAVTTWASIRRWPSLFSIPAVLVEITVAASLLFADGWVYGEAHGQTLGSAWPVAAALAAGIAFGPWPGCAAGITLGLARALGQWVAPFDEASTLALVSSTVLFTLAGGAAGAAMARLRQAEMAMAEARAREEVARTLHDGVLQTLAVVQRRSGDPELVGLARDQELDLRAFLAGDRRRSGDLVPALREAAADVERRDGLRVSVIVVDDPPPTAQPNVVEALQGAVREALTNAAKHGRATQATVFVECDGEIFCSVKDDGVGFDPSATDEGMGITASIRGRLVEVGGSVEIDGRPGAGTEVRLRVPARPRP